MLSEAIKAQIREAYTRMGEAITGFKPRKAQRLMIAEVAKSLGDVSPHAREAEDGCPVIAINAPTGTGKTLAYLLASIPIAKQYGKKVVVSTATIALQEQLVNKDIPNLQKLSGLPFSYALAKGRRRYVCISRLEQLAGSDLYQQALIENETSNSAEQVQFRALAELYENPWDGDRDTLDESVPERLWQQITTDRHGCLARRCSQYRRCAFFRERQKLEKAEVVVVNHSLVLSDLAMGGGALLPDPAQSIYVFDEAHHLPEKALSHFSGHYSLAQMHEWLERVGRVVPKLMQKLPVARQGADKGEKALEAMREVDALHGRLKAWLSEHPDAFSGEVWRFPQGQMPDALRELGKTLRQPLGVLLDRFDDYRDQLEKATKDGEVLTQHAEQLVPEVGAILGALEQAMDSWNLLLKDDESVPTARWLEHTTYRQESDWSLNASPISGAAKLRALLWNKAAGVVLCSATLTALGSFRRFADQAGLSFLDDVQYLDLPTPFDYTRLAELHVPAMQADPSRQDEHTRELIRLLPELFEQHEGGVLTLFASRWQLEAVVDGMPLTLRGKLLIQDAWPKSQLLNMHRQRIAKGERSIIFGLASFAEGIDLPGDLVKHVIITKLPFAVPDDPIAATQIEYIEARGGNPFMELTLPDASVRLVQAVGRLVRTEEDSGQVTILDNRLLSKRYGQQLLKAMPPMRQVLGQ